MSDTPVDELLSLAGRVAVVTGAAGGTGAGIVGRLAEAGASVVVADGDRHGAERTAAAIRAEGRTAIGVEVDVADEGSIGEVATRAVEELGGLDIWVSNAGIYPSVPVLELTVEAWDEVLDHNLRSVLLGAQAAARRMIDAGRGGVIVNLGSTAGFRATPGLAHYVASKFGIRGLTQSLAVELGPHGIRVLGVAPTFVVSPRTRAGRPDLSDDEFAAYLQEVGRTKVLGRVGVPDDVARVVLFAVSDMASLMTGSTLAVDAGDLSR